MAENTQTADKTDAPAVIATSWGDPGADPDSKKIGKPTPKAKSADAKAADKAEGDMDHAIRRGRLQGTVQSGPTRQRQTTR